MTIIHVHDYYTKPIRIVINKSLSTISIHKTCSYNLGLTPPVTSTSFLSKADTSTYIVNAIVSTQKNIKALQKLNIICKLTS